MTSSRANGLIESRLDTILRSRILDLRENQLLLRLCFEESLFNETTIGESSDFVVEDVTSLDAVVGKTSAGRAGGNLKDFGERGDFLSLFLDGVVGERGDGDWGRMMIGTLGLEDSTVSRACDMD